MIEQKIPQINSEALKKARLKKGMELHELANQLCLSPKHITQIEEGGDSAFFSKLHKVQVARKVASLLGLSEAEVIENTSNTESQANEKVEDIKQEVEYEPSDIAVNSMEELEKLGNTDLEKNSSNKKLAFIVSAILILIGLIFWIFSGSNSSQDLVQKVDQKNDVVISANVEEKVDASKEMPPISETTVCEISPQNVSPFKVTKANSAGNFIYFVSKADQIICVVDASNKKQLIKLSALEKRNIVGVAPFTVLSPDFSKLEVYYQGWKVPVSSGTNTIRTEEQSLKSETFRDGQTTSAEQK